MSDETKGVVGEFGFVSLQEPFQYSVPGSGFRWCGVWYEFMTGGGEHKIVKKERGFE